MRSVKLLGGLVVIICAIQVSVITAERHCSCNERIWDCSNHNWTALPTGEKCSTAVTLKLGGNLLENLPDGINHFESIIAPNNKLTRLPSSTKLNSGLKSLDLNNNQISSTSTELQSLSSLRRLTIENNRLTSLQFLPAPCNLYNLDVSKNAITSLSGPLQNCDGLLFLGISDNQITSVTSNLFSKMKKLKYLYLDNNKITSIPDGTFSGLVALKNLALQMNRNLVLSSGSFQGLAELEDLDISFNNLQSLPAGVFSPLTKLVKLDLMMNKLSEIPQNIFANLNSIRHIIIWDNKLTQVPNMQNCCNSLEELSLVGNNISYPSEESLGSVLRGKIQTNLGKHPVRKEALRWALSSKDLESFVETPCSCGGLRRGQATVKFCVNMECSKGSAIKDWRDEGMKFEAILHRNRLLEGFWPPGHKTSRYVIWAAEV